MHVFWWGCIGSIAVELLTILQIYYSEPIILPERYKKPVFYIIRFLLVLMAGGLVIAYDISKPIIAINIGASAPSIIHQLAEFKSINK